MRAFAYLLYPLREQHGIEPQNRAQRTVEADSVEFGPAHVIFRAHGRIVLAERVEQVHELREATQ